MKKLSNNNSIIKNIITKKINRNIKYQNIIKNKNLPNINLHLKNNNLSSPNKKKSFENINYEKKFQEIYKSFKNDINIEPKNIYRSYLLNKNSSKNILDDSNSNKSVLLKTFNLSNRINKKKKNINKQKTTYERIYNDIEKIKQHVDRTILLLKSNINYKLLNQRKNKTIKIKNNNLNNSCTNLNSLLSRKLSNISLFKNENNSNSYNINNNSDLVNSIHNKKIKNKTFISLKSFSTRSGVCFEELFPKNKQYYKNMYHKRKLDINNREIVNINYNIYKTPIFLKQNVFSMKERNMQINIITDKIKLIIENINFYKNNFMYKKIFLNAFNNLPEIKKAELNIKIEEICAIIFKIIPYLLGKFYENLDDVLYLKIPDIIEERKKNPEDEKKCLFMNNLFFNDVFNYFLGCYEILKVLIKKIDGFKFDYNQFLIINLYLDFIRFNISNIISFAKNQIEKYDKDNEIINKFEENINFKPKTIKNKYKEIETKLIEYKKKNNILIIYEVTKIKRINKALETDKKFYDKDLLSKKIKLFQDKMKNQKSLLNSNLISSLMDYMNINIKKKIIANRVIERYKEYEKNNL